MLKSLVSRESRGDYEKRERMREADIRREGALFSIGQMAKLFDMSIQTLRYYDQIGLLRPEFVNESTGYRYYSSRQFERLNTIKYLRTLDVPLERIAAFFKDRDVNLMRGIFTDQLRSVEKKQQELALIERKIRNRISQIDEATKTPLGEIEAVWLPERRIVSLAECFSPAADLEPLIRDLSNRSRLDNAIFLGKVGVSVSKSALEEGSFERLSSVFVCIEEEDNYEGETETIPSGTFLQVRFRGTHRDAAPVYAQLLEYASSNGITVCGGSVETTLIDAGMTSDESHYVTEIQIPVT